MSETVSAAEASKHFGAWQDAAVRQPVIITKNGRPRTVLIGYEDFVRLSMPERLSQLTNELTDAEIAEVERTLLPAGFEYLNAELES